MNFWLTVRTGISDLELVFGFHFSPTVMSELVLICENSVDSIPADKVLKTTRLDLQKRFPIFQVYPIYLAALLCVAAMILFSADAIFASSTSKIWSMSSSNRTRRFEIIH